MVLVDTCIQNGDSLAFTGVTAEGAIEPANQWDTLREKGEHDAILDDIENVRMRQKLQNVCLARLHRKRGAHSEALDAHGCLIAPTRRRQFIQNALLHRRERFSLLHNSGIVEH